MLDFTKTTSDNIDFKNLVHLLDEDLSIRDGDIHLFYDKFNTITNIRNVIICYKDNSPVACGAFKAYDENKAEIKRMFVLPECRKHGLAQAVLKELEDWALSLQFTHCILETDKNQPEAIALYKKAGFKVTQNYGQYQNIENSICMIKPLH